MPPTNATARTEETANLHRELRNSTDISACLSGGWYFIENKSKTEDTLRAAGYGFKSSRIEPLESTA
jgi:hypothetical protein